MLIKILIVLILGQLSKSQKSTLKLNIREIPLDPFNSSAVLEIGLMIYILDLEPFKELDMDYRIDYVMKQVWWPHSNFCLALYDDLEISPERKKPFKTVVLYEKTDLKKIWLPDTFAANSKDERLSSDTEALESVVLSMIAEKKCVVEYQSKLNARLTCLLNFQFYPFDEQYCNMTIRNYAINNKLVKYKWLTKGDSDWRAFKNDERVFLTEGVVLMYPLRLVQFEINAFSDIYTDSLYFKFASLFVTFVYKRKIFGSIITVYLPSTLLLAVSWTSFFIDIDEVGRVLNCMTCFLSLLTQFINIRSELPVMSYINGTDIWMLTCLIFVFLNLVQFTIVKYIQNNITSQHLQNNYSKRRKSSLNDEKALNIYLMQKNRERFQVVKKLKTLNKKEANFKKTELIKYLAISKIENKNRSMIDTNPRLDFVAKKDVKNLNHKSFLTNDDYYKTDRLLDFNQDNQNTNYDRVLKERIDRLVKYNSSSSSSSSSDSGEEESWFQKIKPDYEVKNLIHKIDVLSRITFFIGFLIFNLIYWPFMIINSSKSSSIL